MPYHSNNSSDDNGDYSDFRRHSFQPSSGNQQRLTDLPAPPESTNVNQGLAHPFSLGYPPQAAIDGSMDHYPTGASDPGHYGTVPQYQQVHDPTFHQHLHGTTLAPYTPSQSTRDAYPQHGLNVQWAHGHHHPGANFQRSASWSPPHHTGHSAPPNFQQGSMSMPTHNNSRGRREVMIPQRAYVPHHRQNYFDQFTPENAISFFNRSGREGIALTDVKNENFDYLVGRDEPMFANYTGPAISLRLEWPGYRSWTRQIKTRDWRREPQPITKAKLAIEVEKKVRDFIQGGVNDPVTPGSERWRVGPGFIEAKHLELVRLVHVSKGSWQAEFRAIE